MTLTLPLRQSVEITRQSTPWKETAAQKVTPANPAEEEIVSGTSEKERSMVLVVEDNADITQYITILLGTHYEVRRLPTDMRHCSLPRNSTLTSSLLT